MKRSVVLAAGLCILLSGCLLQRVMTLQDQICDFENNFELSTIGGFQLRLLNPVILDRDVIFMAGVDPYRVTPMPGGQEMTYRIRKRGQPVDDTVQYSIDLRFVEIDEEMKLSELSVDSIFPMIVTDEQVARATERACSNRGFPSPRIEYPLDDIDASLIPTLAELRLLAGEPSDVSEDGTTVRYDYVVDGRPDDNKQGHIELVYDGSGERILRVTSKYSRYVTVADFNTMMAYTSISL